MANEALVRASLQIIKTGLDYRSQPTAFYATVTGTKGPSPGAITATTAGIDVNLSELPNPSLCRIMNLDSTNYVEFGIFDGATFRPLIEVAPKELYVIRLSRNLLIGQTFRVRANTANCNVLIEAFEK
jgi:hypothetical protein